MNFFFLCKKSIIIFYEVFYLSLLTYFCGCNQKIFNFTKYYIQRVIYYMARCLKGIQ